MKFVSPSPTEAEIMYVLENLREKSKEDIFGATDDDAYGIANYLVWADGFKWVFYHDAYPAALLGATKMHDGVWNLFGMGTDDWQKVWRLVTLVAKRDMMQAVLDAGAHRAQCMSPASHEDTHKWLRFLGATHEAEMPKWGKNGEDYIMFSWLKE